MFSGKGRTAKKLLIVTEKRLLEIGIQADKYYDMAFLAKNLHIARSSVSRLLVKVPHNNDAFKHHNTKIGGMLNRYVFLGKDLLEFFRRRDAHFGVNYDSEKTQAENAKTGNENTSASAEKS